MADSRMKQLSDQARELAARHIGIAVLCARPWMRMLPSLREEFIGAAHVGLCLAARDWDPDRGGIGNFIKVRVNSECNNVRKKFRRACRTVTGTRVDGLDEVASQDMPLPLEGGETVAALLGSLPERNAAVVHAVIIKGWTTTRVGSVYGCCRKTTGVIVAESLAALRRHPLVIAMEGVVR